MHLSFGCIFFGFEIFFVFVKTFFQLIDAVFVFDNYPSEDEQPEYEKQFHVPCSFSCG